MQSILHKYSKEANARYTPLPHPATSSRMASVPYNGTPYLAAESPGNRSPIIWEQEGTGQAPFFLPLQGAKIGNTHTCNAD